jgi:hypothetical protein
MKNFKRFHLSIIPLVFLTTCHIWNFYPDADDPDLSRFTSRGYNVATNYINDRPFKNTYHDPLLYKDSTGNSIDTLRFTWELYPNDSARTTFAYHSISFLLPVPHSFNKTNLLAFNRQRFLNSVRVTLRDSSFKTITGLGSLYFVSVTESVSYPAEKYIKLSGLFDGNIGDSVNITKGRFDFEIKENTLNF